jgi:hypothetical protein
LDDALGIDATVITYANTPVFTGNHHIIGEHHLIAQADADTFIGVSSVQNTALTDYHRIPQSDFTGLPQDYSGSKLTALAAAGKDLGPKKAAQGHASGPRQRG